MSDSHRFDTPAVIQQVKSDAAADRTGKINLSDPLNWETYIDRMVEFEALTGKELLYGGQTASNLSHRITLRDDPETRLITAAHRVQIAEQYFGITAVKRLHGRSDQKKRLIELMVTERTT